MIAGTYIVTGAEMPQPIVALLDVGQCASLAEAVRLAAKRQSVEMLRAVYAGAFGAGAEYCFPATGPMLEHIVSDEFNAPHRDAVRSIAALLILGQPIPSDEPPEAGGDGGGGQGARLVPDKPRSPPGGARAALVF